MSNDPDYQEMRALLTECIGTLKTITDTSEQLSRSTIKFRIQEAWNKLLAADHISSGIKS